MAKNENTDPVILTEVQDRVGVIRINRGYAMNALNEDVMHALVNQAEEWERDENIMAIVVTGNEKAFAAGADIKEMASRTYMDMYMTNFFHAWDRLTNVRIPMIAAVNGYALGGGCELAMMCDILIAGPSTKFGQPEINLGVIPGMGGSQRLTRAIGKAKAMDMVLTGRMMDAEEAEKTGLVSRLVEDDSQVFDTAMELAQEIATKPRPAVMVGKESVQAVFETTLNQGLQFERRTFFALFATEDQKEGMDAFANKRKPNFTDR